MCIATTPAGPRESLKPTMEVTLEPTLEPTPLLSLDLLAPTSRDFDKDNPYDIELPIFTDAPWDTLNASNWEAVLTHSNLRQRIAWLKEVGMRAIKGTREWAVLHCQHVVGRSIGADGRVNLHRRPCRNFRACPICFETRMKKFQDDMNARGQFEPKLRIVELSKSATAKLNRAIGAENLRAFPIANGNSMVFVKDINDEYTELGSCYMEVMDEIDWAIIAATPEGRRTTGKLYKRVPKTENKIKTELVVINLEGSSVAVEDEAWAAAIEETKHLEPIDIPSVERAIDARIQSFKFHFVRLGGKIDYTTGITCKINSVSDWTNNTEFILRDYEVAKWRIYPKKSK